MITLSPTFVALVSRVHVQCMILFYIYIYYYNIIMILLCKCAATISYIDNNCIYNCRLVQWCYFLHDLNKGAQVHYTFYTVYYTYVYYIRLFVFPQERKTFSDEEKVAVATNHRRRYCRHA